MTRRKVSARDPRSTPQPGDWQTATREARMFAMPEVDARHSATILEAR